MKSKLFLFCLLLVVSQTLYSANPITSFQMDINAEKRREEQEKLRKIEKNPPKETEYKVNEIVVPAEEKGTKIKKIIITGNSVVSDFDIKLIIKKYIGKKGGTNIINFLKELENFYLEKGYIATRVKIDMQNSNFKEGIVAYKILEGDIEKIVFKEPILYEKEKIFFSFPCKEGDIVNLKDLDQGIDNINSVSSNNAKFDLIPGEKIGSTIIEVENQKSKKISGTINYNNLGQETTGEERGKISLTFSDVLGFNDSLTGTYQRKLGRKRDERDNENFSFYYRVPYKYWEFYISKDKSEYLSTIRALNQKYKSDGVSENMTYGLRRVIHRDSDSKTDLGVSLINKDTKNYIEDIKLITSSRKLSMLKFDLNDSRKFLNGILYSNIEYYRGIDRFGAESDDGKGEDDPLAQFTKYTLDLNWYKPFQIKNQNFTYRFGFSGQYSDDILYSSEKLGIGDDTTVRGFKENSIMGDKGFYLRNELSYSYKIFEPFIAYDLGRVKDNYKDEFYKRYGNEMTGISIGLRVYYKGLIGSITYSKALTAPSYIEKEPQEVYISISYSF
ncbi:ShlB/FhaC/HecB family hemolysin secretion/activation protein [Fusobacterium mortiferum]|uniref:ShlB/FhaC/HecB family hemolysin secretion/activation protein n=1 Tax=Fusobacterium mortiferum TaxID=850 RepID=UPI0022DF9D01|nr:ShlB/FhaC/HecB family hemolysin secretion/activation protein [Fusobacterium mortiferum]